MGLALSPVSMGTAAPCPAHPHSRRGGSETRPYVITPPAHRPFDGSRPVGARHAVPLCVQAHPISPPRAAVASAHPAVNSCGPRPAPTDPPPSLPHTATPRLRLAVGHELRPDRAVGEEVDHHVRRRPVEVDAAPPVARRGAIAGVAHTQVVHPILRVGVSAARRRRTGIPDARDVVASCLPFLGGLRGVPWLGAHDAAAGLMALPHHDEGTPVGLGHDRAKGVHIRAPDGAE